MNKTLMVTASIIAATSFAARDASADVSFLNIATATTGGSFYPAGIAIANLISDNLDVTASATSSAGSVENVTLLENNEANMAFIQINVVQDALDGINDFDGEAFTGMEILTPMFRSVDHFVVNRDSGIDTAEDFADKRIAVGRAGSGTIVTSEAFLEAFDMTIDDIEPDYIGQSEALTALQNGVIDGAPISGGTPLSAVSEAMTTAGDSLEIYSMSPEEQEAFVTSSGWKVSHTIPAGTYEGQDEDVNTTAHLALLMVPSDFPEDLAEDIVSLMFEEVETLRSAHGVFGTFDRDSSIEALEQLSDMPVNAGARQYFGLD